MKKNYIVPQTFWGPANLEECLLANSGNSSDMGYEEIPGVIWTY